MTYINSYNKLIYGGFLVLGLYFLLFKKDPGEAVIYLGIALIGDPFDQEKSWSARPLYQRIWLILHLVLLFATIAYSLLQ